MRNVTRLAIVSGMLVLSTMWRSEAQTAATNVSHGAYDAEQAQRGKLVYDAQCASCHGATLDGIDAGKPLAGPEFLGNWSGQSVGDLSARIRTTMPLDRPGSLNLTDTAAVTAYLLQHNGFKAGAAALPERAADQKRLIIDRPSSAE